MRDFNAAYAGDHLDHFAFPLGGIGAGMVALLGHGALGQVSLRHRPDINFEPYTAAGLFLEGHGGRLLQGPAPHAHVLAKPGAGNGLKNNVYGLPRFAKAVATARFPFLAIELSDPGLPVAATVTGWSPFTPGRAGGADDSSLPAAGLVYTLRNKTKKPVKGVFSFHAENFMRVDEFHDGTSRVRPLRGGFVVEQDARADHPEHAGAFAAFTTAPGAVADCAWFRGGWWDCYTLVWEAMNTGAVRKAGPHPAGKRASDGGSLYVPFRLAAGDALEIPVLLAWHVPDSTLRTGRDADPASCAPGCLCRPKKDAAAPATYKPWYAARFKDVDAAAAHWRKHYARLHAESAAFRDAFFDTTLPAEIVEAAAANLSILKSPTCLRQHDGRFWAWEGCWEGSGCCDGTCSHVWNYAQALPHLFPDLERSIRETEFGPSQNEAGHQRFRAALPIRPNAEHDFHAALDGELGGLVKLYREWRISGDDAWLRGLWPAARAAMEYCIRTWDPDRAGLASEPHHNTYDIEFWGPNGFAQTFYLGALAACARMAEAAGDPSDEYDALFERGRAALHKELYNGEWFIQRVQWKGLRAAPPDGKGNAWNVNYTPEALALLRKEGPKYQYGGGLLADGLLGECLALWCGLPPAVEPAKARRHLRALVRHNLRKDLSLHANPQRPTYAFGDEGGLLMCTWPRGGELRLPMVYAHEVWTGIEYQVAAHLAFLGEGNGSRAVVATARRRYDGRRRNPFDEFECGHWYARAMASYGLLQAWSGARYDAVERTLYLRPPAGLHGKSGKSGKSGDFRAFICTATGYGTVGLRRGKPFLDVRGGAIPVEQIVTDR